MLLVDDNPGKLLGLESALEHLPIRLLTATSARAALRLLVREDVAVILLDVHMPEMNGFELASLIRQRPRFEATPIIFVTAISTSEQDRSQGYGLGAVDYMAMPVQKEVLRAKVMALVDLHRKTLQVQRQAEQLARLNSALEAQVQRSEALNQQLSAANSELEAFTYSVSHDLRSPRVASFVSLLRSDLDSPSAAVSESLGFIDAGLGRADRLIEGLLQLAQVTRTEVARTPLDLADLSRSLLPELEIPAGAELVLPERLPACGDPELLGVVLQNLLGNALKFSSRVEHARVELGSTADGAFFVRDNGAGFSPERAHRLFTPFQRLHSQEQFPGTGIGLATVRRVVRRHGGEIWAESEVDRGATFFWTLPVPQGDF